MKNVKIVAKKEAFLRMMKFYNSAIFYSREQIINFVK